MESNIQLVSAMAQGQLQKLKTTEGT